MQFVRKKSLLFAVLAMLCTLVGVSTSTGVADASTTQITVTASEDGYVKADDPTSTFGTTTPLRVDGSPVWNAYLKFVVPACTVSTATLRLTAASTASAATDIKTAASTWTEAGLTYNNAPAAGSSVGSMSSTTSGTAYDTTVTSSVAGSSTVTFVLTTASSTARTFNSREASTGKPQLILDCTDSVDTMHSISMMEQDAVGGSFSTKARFEGYHGGTAQDPYVFDITVRQTSGDSEGMNLVFREQDLDTEFDQMDIEEDAVLLRQKVNNTNVTKATGCTGYGSLNTSYRVTLWLKGNVWEVYENGGSTPCVTWTDTANTYPSGNNASYYCMPNNYCIWEKVEAGPASKVASVLAWDFANQDPGYRTAQTISGTAQSILESRPVYTIENYCFGTNCPNGGSLSTLDIMEHGADGNVEYHLDEWSDFGTRIIYRAKVGQYGYHVQLDDGETKLRRKNANGTYTVLATASGSGVPLNRHVKVVVEGDRHRLIDETDCNPTCTTYWDVTDSTWVQGNKTYWGNVTVNGATLRGSFRALAD